MTALDTKALAWLIKSNCGGNTWVQLSPEIADADRDFVDIVPLYALSPSQGEGPAADVVEAAKAVIADWDHRLPDGPESFKTNEERFSYWSPHASMVSSEPMSRLRAALASLAPGAAQEAPADEQSGETSHVAVSDAMVEAAQTELGHFGIYASTPTVRAALTAALAAEPGEAVAPKEAFYAGFGAGEANGKFDDDNVDDAWSRYLAHPHPHPLPLKEEVERVLEIARIYIADDVKRRPSDYDPSKDLTRLEALLSRIRAGAQEGWRPIETAPKDGQIIWAWLHQTGIRAVRWSSAEEYAEKNGGSPDEYVSAWVEADDEDEQWWSPRWWLPYDAIPAAPSPWHPGKSHPYDDLARARRLIEGNGNG